MAELDRTVPYYKEVAGMLVPGGFSVEAFEGALKYVPRDGDFFISTYPKSGTTWTQQIVYLIYNRGVPGDNVLDVFKRIPYLDMYGIESAEEMLRPGAIKIHLPFELTPYSDQAKYLYIARNPKDVCVSYYHHMSTDEVFAFQEGTFDRYFEDFITGRIAYNDYFDHILGWYERRDQPNIMILTYEEMKKDPKKVVLNIAKFMGEEWFQMLQDDEAILSSVLKYSSLELMKDLFNFDRPKNVKVLAQADSMIYPGWQYVRRFSETHRKETDKQFVYIREGKLGSWRDVMSADQLARLDARTEQKIKHTELYKYWKSIACL